MAVTINADTTNGLVMTPDTSGEIKLQSAGTDIATVNSSGIAATTFIPTSSTVPTNGVYLATTNTVGLATNTTERMRIDSNGRVYIGTTSQIIGTHNHKLGVVAAGVDTPISTDVNQTVDRYAIDFHNPNGRVGSILTSGSSTSYNTSSDYRLKENNVNITDGITRVKQLTPYRFNFIADADTTVDGFFAHEVQSVVPEAISGTHNEVDDDGNPVYQGIDQAKLVPLLTSALQEAITKIEDLETRIQTLENA